MLKLNELLAQAESLTEELDALSGKMAEAETDEELASLKEKSDAKEKEFDALTEDIERAKAQAERKRMIADARAGLEDDPADGKTVDPDAPDQPQETTGGVKVTQSKEREHIKLFTQYMGGKSIDSYSDNERDFLHPDEGSQFDEGKEGVRMPRSWLPLMFGDRWGKAMDCYRSFGSKAMQSDDTADAYLVDTDYLAELLQLEPEPEHLMGQVTVIPVTGGQVDIPCLQQTDANEYGGMSFTWIDEGAEKGETEPTIEQKSITTHEISGYTEISKTLARRNAVSAIQIVQNLYRSGIRAALDEAIISGSGTGQPQGIVNATGIRTQIRDAAGDVSQTDMINLKHNVLAHHDGMFIIHDEVQAALEIDDISAENPAFKDGMLVRKPYMVTERQPELGNDGDAIYGDPRSYYLAMEQDVVVEQSRHYRFRNNVIAFAVYAVAGGQLALPRGMAILQSTTS